MNKELEKFNYVLPPKLIAQNPARPRDSARLLVYQRNSGQINDSVFSKLNEWLPADTTLVVNNSKVDKARLKFGKLEIFVTQKLAPDEAVAMVYPGKKFLSGEQLKLAPGITAKVSRVLTDGQRHIKLNINLSDNRLNKYRHTPFPPYIKPNEKLAEEYQTVFAQDENHGGSLAAPTAGLHFTHSGLAKIKQLHPVAEVTLHVGLGTFAPLKAENLKTSKLHKEWYSISNQTADLLNQAKLITAVGTTSARVLESAINKDQFLAGSAYTQLFIRPGYEFKAVDSLITNFHLPKSSLLMLVGAFMGFEELKRVYQHAIDNNYRFYSFGDAMLII